MHLNHGGGRTKPQQADGKKIEPRKRFRSRAFAQDMRCFCTKLTTLLGDGNRIMPAHDGMPRSTHLTCHASSGSDTAFSTHVYYFTLAAAAAAA